MGSEFDDLLGPMLDECNSVFGRPLTMTRETVVISFRGDVRRAPRDETLQPSDLPTEGSRVTLWIKVTDLGVLGRPRHKDIVTTEGGERWEISGVDDDTELSVLCHLIEPEE
jgi:hypothetical protein